MNNENTKKQLLQMRQLASQACKRYQEIRRSVSLLADTKLEDMPKWKRDTLLRAEQHLVNCAEAYRRVLRVETVAELEDVQKEYAKNLLEQRVPPFKSQLKVQTHEQDIAELLKEFKSSEREASVFF